MTSLPVPVSPSMRTAESVGATVRTSSSVFIRAVLHPTIPSNSCRFKRFSLAKLMLAKLHASGEAIFGLPILHPPRLLYLLLSSSGLTDVLGARGPPPGKPASISDFEDQRSSWTADFIRSVKFVVCDSLHWNIPTVGWNRMTPYDPWRHGSSPALICESHLICQLHVFLCSLASAYINATVATSLKMSCAKVEFVQCQSVSGVGVGKSTRCVGGPTVHRLILGDAGRKSDVRGASTLLWLHELTLTDSGQCSGYRARQNPQNLVPQQVKLAVAQMVKTPTKNQR